MPLSSLPHLGRSASDGNSSSGSVLASVLAHALLLAIFVALLRTHLNIAPLKLPGTVTGTRLLTYSAGGSPAHTAGTLAKKVAPHTKPAKSAEALHAPASAPQSPPADLGTGTSSESAHGDGEIQIALPTFSPHPNPDLAALSAGTSGDVVLNAVIDEHGKVTDLTLLHGLSQAIDATVIATVKTWTYTPAQRNGLPVPSEQEFHFHYERS